MSDPLANLKHKGNALKEMMAILIRKELAQSYELNLTEMYLILDYIEMMQDTEEKLRQRVEALEDVLREANTCVNETGFFDGTFFSQARERLKKAIQVAKKE